MRFLEHIENIDLIIKEKEENDRKKALLNTEIQFNNGAGMGFSSTNYSVMTTGNMTTIGGFENGSYHSATIFNTPSGFTVNRNW